MTRQPINQPPDDAAPRHVCPSCGNVDVTVPWLWQAAAWTWAAAGMSAWVPIIGWVAFPFLLFGALVMTALAIVVRRKARCDECGWAGKPRAARKAAKAAA